MFQSRVSINRNICSDQGPKGALERKRHFFSQLMASVVIVADCVTFVHREHIYCQQCIATPDELRGRLVLCTEQLRLVQKLLNMATPVGFEPTRGDPIGLAGRRLNRSAKVSSNTDHGMTCLSRLGGPAQV